MRYIIRQSKDTCKMIEVLLYFFNCSGLYIEENERAVIEEVPTHQISPWDAWSETFRCCLKWMSLIAIFLQKTTNWFRVFNVWCHLHMLHPLESSFLQILLNKNSLLIRMLTFWFTFLQKSCFKSYKLLFCFRCYLMCSKSWCFRTKTWFKG